MSRFSKALLSCGLLAIAGAATAVAQPAPTGAEEDSLLLLDEEPVVEVEEEVARLFPMPFVSAHLLRDVQRVLREEEILAERMTLIVWDLKNRLMWPKRDNGRDVDWKNAGLYCEELVFAGYEDWRLPTIEELETLHRVMAKVTYKLPVEIQLTACCPWSSTRRGERSAWNFNFRSRKRFSGTVTYSYDLRALCVRTPGLDETPADSQLPSRLYTTGSRQRRGGRG